ncbi:MAG: sigma-54-dependent Fis family transcriptional regulator [Nitrospirae bacterium]|nr:sigma-54-dependent Fis family transcriptional regulator [Nitrospirota bacterium]
MKGKLLIIEDDKIFCSMLRRHFEGEYRIVAFSDPGEAVKFLRKDRVDVVLTDLNMPEIDGLEILNIVKAGSFNTDVVIMTAFGRVDTAVEAMKKGAYDYIAKPFTMDELSLQLANIFDKRRLFEENINLRKVVETTYRPENILGESDRMKEVYRFIELVSKMDATALITGESGTGKELVARALHFSGKRKDRRFVSINCSAIPETLLESELFGYTKGSFTGAGSDKQGLFEYADGGTLLLDEIADASPSIQAKLLRVLQERRLRPIGSGSEVAVDVRVICATNRDLREMIAEGKFREDLFYRINVVSVHLPPLRERREDIPLLLTRFVNKRKKIDPRVDAILAHYNWPGNVRELKNLVEKVVTLSDADTIGPGDLPQEMLSVPCPFDDKLSYGAAKKKVIDDFNRAIINRVLIRSDGNVSKAAEELQLDRANFLRLMRKYQISSKEFKQQQE